MTATIEASVTAFGIEVYLEPSSGEQSKTGK